MIGQFFIELNELSKISNKRIKEFREDKEKHQGRFQAYEGYFTMVSSSSDRLSSDRLGMRIYLFHPDTNGPDINLHEMNAIFNNFRPNIELQIAQKLDKKSLGYVEIE